MHHVLVKYMVYLQSINYIKTHQSECKVPTPWISLYIGTEEEISVQIQYLQNIYYYPQGILESNMKASTQHPSL